MPVITRRGFFMGVAALMPALTTGDVSAAQSAKLDKLLVEALNHLRLLPEQTALTVRDALAKLKPGQSIKIARGHYHEGGSCVVKNNVIYSNSGGVRN